jgi:hypothetical protein
LHVHRRVLTGFCFGVEVQVIDMINSLQLCGVCR